MMFPFFTIGHSTRPIGEFIDLLTASEIGIVEQVFHILGPGKVAIASLAPGARPGPRDTVTYPPQVAVAVHE